MDKARFTWTTMLSLALFTVLLVMAIYPGKSEFAGAHTMRVIINDSTYGDAYFCWKCHAGQVVNITSNGSFKAHNSTDCICHGYHPNRTILSGPYGKLGSNIFNISHNLTMDIYCTNCHANYSYDDPVGNVTMNNNPIVKTTHQSGHYIYFNGSSFTSVNTTYNRSWRYFTTRFGSLS